MKKTTVCLILSACLLGAPTQARHDDSRSAPKLAHTFEYVPGELLVKYKSSARAAAMEYFQNHRGVLTIRSFQRINIHHLKLPREMTVEQGLEIYRNDPDVEHVEPNYYRRLAATPTDIFFDRLWGLNNTGQQVNGTSGDNEADMDAPEAWDIHTDCGTVVVAVIDSGVDYNHPDLSSNVWSNTLEATGVGGDDDDSNGYADDIRGWDFVDNDNDPVDSHGHGSHVAGTIAAEGDNGSGITGVCWSGQVMVLRAFDAFGSGTTAHIIAAMEYARQNGAKVINASYGGPSFSVLEQAEIANANGAGILFIAAAGNDGTSGTTAPFYPASYDLPNIISVAATDQNDNLAFFSNFGVGFVDVAAPGTNIYSARPDRQTVWSDDFGDGDMSDWTVGQEPGSGALEDWNLTTSLSFSGSYSLTDSPSGNYENDAHSWARSPQLDLSSQNGTKLALKLRGESLGSDRLYVEAATNAGGPWMNKTILIGTSDIFERGVSGSYGQWVDCTVDLGPLDGEDPAYFRFRLQTDGSGTRDGWTIDDVEVTASDSTYPPPEDQHYRFLQGTSMATPHVSGLAALVWTLSPGLTLTQVKERILNSVDRRISLGGKVFTGGRVNGLNSILNLPAPPANLSATAVSTSEINLTWAVNYYGQIAFEIERKTGATGTYTKIVDLNSNTASYSDTGLSTSTTYTYRVRAYNSDNLSTYSAEATETTQAPLSGGSGGGGGGSCFIEAASPCLTPLNLK